MASNNSSSCMHPRQHEEKNSPSWSTSCIWLRTHQLCMHRALDAVHTGAAAETQQRTFQLSQHTPSPHRVSCLCSPPGEVCDVLVVVALQLACLGCSSQCTKQGLVRHTQAAKRPGCIGHILWGKGCASAATRHMQGIPCWGLHTQAVRSGNGAHAPKKLVATEQVCMCCALPSRCHALCSCWQAPPSVTPVAASVLPAVRPCHRLPASLPRACGPTGRQAATDRLVLRAVSLLYLKQHQPCALILPRGSQ